MASDMPLKSELMQKAKELATSQHPTGFREMARDLRGRGKHLLAAVYEHLAETSEVVLNGNEILPCRLPTGLTIEGIVAACPEGGSISQIVHARNCVATYARLTYGQYI